MRAVPGWFAVLPWVLLAGCVGAEKKADRPARPGGPRVQCYQGQGEVVLADGQRSPAGEKLVRRTVDALNTRILEETLEVDPSGERPPLVWFARLRVEHNRKPLPAAREANLRCAWFFRAREARDLFEGLGCLEGEPWEWTAWEATYRFFNRGRLEIRARLGPDGLALSQEVYDDMDRLGARVEELLAPVDPSICSQRLPPPP
jgi:hypothetical protein